MHIELASIGVLLLAALAEWLHHRRGRRIGALAFGPEGQARSWTKAAPVLRSVSAGLLSWGLLHLAVMDPQVRKPKEIPEGGYRHLVIVLDVSPSMQLKDAGPTRELTRAKRAGELVISLLERIRLEQVRVSVVAFYTGARPVVVDTYDVEVVKNILNDLPLDQAFDIGKTSLIKGIQEAFELARPWQQSSTTMVIVSDGDTVPDSGLSAMPKSIQKVLVVGVGDPRAGKFIDGHQSRQDVSTLRQIAGRLRGAYHDGNEKHLPSEQLTALAQALPMQENNQRGSRELALAAVALGSALLAGLPIALALAGTPWQARYWPAKVQTRKLDESMALRH